MEKIDSINLILENLLLKTTNKKLRKEKFYIIIETNFRYKALIIMHSINIIAKLGNIMN